MTSALRNSLRRAVRGWLDRHDRRLVHLPPGQVTGADLVRDLRAVVTASRPVCLDVGANEGQSVELFQRAFVDARIHAFEPSSAAAARLRARRFSPAVTIHQCALGRTAGTREFLNYARPDLSSFLPLEHAGEHPFHEVPVVDREVVRVTTIDDVVREQGLTTIDLIKIDAQGFEAEVLAGASQTLGRGIIHAVLVELNFVAIYAGQADPAVVVSSLHEAGLRLVDYYDKARHGHTLGWCTALFARADHAAPSWTHE